MKVCLSKICKEFEELSEFLSNRSHNDILKINKLFLEFLDCFSSLDAERLEYPKEFQNDVKLYLEGHPILVKKFEDVEIRYLMLSDFYDFCRLTKKYKRGNSAKLWSI